MAINRKNGRYYVSVDIGTHDRYICGQCGWKSWDRATACGDCGGALHVVPERRRATPGRGFARSRDADAAQARLKEEYRTGRYISPSDMTVGEWVIEWIGMADLQSNTRENYRVMARAYVEPWIGRVPLQELTPVHLDRLYLDLMDRGGRGGKALSPKTVRNVAMMLRAALGSAKKKRIIRDNPSDDSDIPRHKRSVTKAWSDEQLRRFIEHTKEDRLFPAVLLTATTGMRRSEVLGLGWAQVDLDRAQLVVSQRLLAVGSTLELLPHTKTGGGRLLALDAWTVEVLREHRRRQLEERMAAGPVWVDTGLVFTQEDGSPLPPKRFTSWMSRQQTQAGVDRIGVHGLRHTFATIGLRHGEHPKVISERLGHRSIRTTLDVYSHAIPEMQREAADRFAALLRTDNSQDGGRMAESLQRRQLPYPAHQETPGR